MIAPDFGRMRVLARSPQPGSARGHPSREGSPQPEEVLWDVGERREFALRWSWFVGQSEGENKVYSGWRDSWAHRRRARSWGWRSIGLTFAIFAVPMLFAAYFVTRITLKAH